jgi:hypothetical protein
MKIEIEINSCQECPYFDKRRMYTSDSFEEAYDWFCKKADNKKIQGYVEWHEEEDIKIPEWCPCKVKQ